jgi:hypothetical protein
VPVPLQKASKRGLLALAILCIVGLATFAALASSSVFRGRSKDAVAARVKPAS